MAATAVLPAASCAGHSRSSQCRERMSYLQIQGRRRGNSRPTHMCTCRGTGRLAWLAGHRVTVAAWFAVRSLHSLFLACTSSVLRRCRCLGTRRRRHNSTCSGTGRLAGVAAMAEVPAASCAGRSRCSPYRERMSSFLQSLGHRRGNSRLMHMCTCRGTGRLA